MTTTTTTTDFTLTTEITALPLSQLIPSKENARRTGSKDGIGQLAASITAHGLRQNLNVRPVPDSDRFEVVAGGRRLKALRLLVKQKKLAKDAPIACRILTHDEDAGEISLVENVQRLAMHPLDEFEAFDRLASERLPVEDIAARFGVDPSHVERRLKLARVSPKLRALYRKDDMTLQQLMAFTLSDDHAEQERVWKDLPEWDRRNPRTIKAALTTELVSPTDKLACFVGMEAYMSAGGGVVRDLFEDGQAGYLTDRPLLVKLAAEKLQSEAERFKAEGWGFAHASFEQDHSARYDWLNPLPNEDEEDDTERFTPEDMARGGVLLSIGYRGEVEVSLGVLLPEACDEEDGYEPSPAIVPKAKPDAAKGEYAASIIEELTAHRTAALRNELVNNPHMALVVAVHAMALKVFFPYASAPSCMGLRLEQTDLARRIKSQEECSAHAGLQDQKERWEQFLPEDADLLFEWCLTAGTEHLMGLLAYCTAMAVSAVQTKFDKAGRGHLAHADQLAAALALDMTDYWQGTAEGFYGAVPKAALVHAVSEAKAPMQVSITDLKKHEAARYVEKAMADTGWLPAPLRHALPVSDAAEVMDEAAGEDASAEAVAA